VDWGAGENGVEAVPLASLLKGVSAYKPSRGVFFRPKFSFFQDTNHESAALGYVGSLHLGAKFGGWPISRSQDTWIKGDKINAQPGPGCYQSGRSQIYQARTKRQHQTRSDFYGLEQGALLTTSTPGGPRKARRFDFRMEAETNPQGTAWFDYDGNSIRESSGWGGNPVVRAPLNSGDPFQRGRMWGNIVPGGECPGSEGRSTSPVNPCHLAWEAPQF